MKPIAALAAIVLAAAAQAAPVTIANDRLALTFDPQAKALGLRDTTLGRELLVPGASRLFALEFSRAGDATGKRETVTARDAERVEAGAQDRLARLSFSGFGGRAIAVAVSLAAPAGDPFLRWRIEVTLPEGLVLEAVRFPAVTLAARQGDTEAYVAGATKGGVFHRPSNWPGGQWLGFSQPGSLAAQFACYYDAAGGLMTGALDAEGYPKGVAISRGGDGFELAWLHPCFATGRYRTAFDVVQAAFGQAGQPADWRDAADLYKAWAIKQPWCARQLPQRDDLPGWLRQGPAMVRFNRGWLARPETVERWLSDYWRKHFPRVPLIAAWWGWEKVDTWVTPDYFPVYPSDETFSRLAGAVRQTNGHSFLWPSGYHYTLTFDKRPDGSFAWDDRARFDQVARPHAVVARNGQVLIGDRSWLRGGQTATLCPGDPWTIDWFNRIGVECVKRGAELVQVDQVVGGAFPACYSREHGHPPGPGLWQTEAFRRQMTALAAACRAVDPAAVVCYEEPNEQFNHLAGLQDYRDWEVLNRGGAEPASVFGYLYHEYLPLFQSNPRAGDRLQAAYCLASGQVPHLVPSMRSGAGPALEGGDMEAWGAAAPLGWDKVDGYQGQSWTGLAERDETVRHGGTASLRLTNREAGQTVQVSQNVPVGGGFQPGRAYRLSAQVKSGGLTQANGILLGTFTSAMATTGGGGRIELPQAAGDWVRGEADFTVPPGTALLRIMIHLTGPGTLWVDDLKLEELRPDGTAVEVARPELPQDHDLMHAWVELFAGAGRPYLLLGRMLHPPRLTCATVEAHNRPFPAILHNAYEAPDGSRAVVLVNATDTPQIGKLTWAGTEREVRLEAWEARLVR